MEGTSSRRKRLPPRWFVRIAWAVHRAVTRLTGGRRGLDVVVLEPLGHDQTAADVQRVAGPTV